MDGEIVLANDLKLAFSDDPLVDTDCPGQGTHANIVRLLYIVQYLLMFISRFHSVN